MALSNCDTESDFIDLRKRIARLGHEMFLNMILKDNLVHSDLHPGNLLVDLPSYENGNTLSLVMKL